MNSITRLLESRLGVVVDDPDQDLFDSGALDSLSFVNLLVELETEFGMEILLDDLDFEAFSTVRGIAAFVEQAQAESMTEAG